MTAAAQTSRPTTTPTTPEDFQAIADQLPKAKDIDGKTYTWPDMTGPKRQARDMAAAKSVSAWALIHDGQPAGRLVWVIGGGGAWTCDITAHAGPLKPMPIMTGTAGGHGYCKRSASFADALTRAGIKCHGIAGRGEGAIREWLTDRGYTVAEIL